jgi:hypothetical protein
MNIGINGLTKAGLIRYGYWRRNGFDSDAAMAKLIKEDG